MPTLAQDVKYAFRTLAASPGFVAAAVLSLALGIGANTAIFTLTDAVFLNPLPVQEPSRILEVYTVDHLTKGISILCAFRCIKAACSTPSIARERGPSLW
jgi:hypothetical protein